MVCKQSVALFGLLTVVLLAFAAVPTANGASVLAGSDYLTTVPVTEFDFGPGIGVVPLEGRFGPGVADTVVTRLKDAILPAVGSSDTIPIQMRLLELKSTAPVDIGGSFFDVFVHLDPSLSSLGTMTISHEFPDDGGLAPEGTFTSHLVVKFLAEFDPVLPGSSFAVTGSLALDTDPAALWSHEPPPGALLVTGPRGNLDANSHTPLPPDFNDFFLLQGVIEVHPGVGIHTAVFALQPCPGCPGPPLQDIRARARHVCPAGFRARAACFAAGTG